MPIGLRRDLFGQTMTGPVQHASGRSVESEWVQHEPAPFFFTVNPRAKAPDDHGMNSCTRVGPSDFAVAGEPEAPEQRTAHAVKKITRDFPNIAGSIP